LTIFQKLSADWKEDNLLRRIVRNSSYLFGSNVISAVLSFGQTIIAVRLLDLKLGDRYIGCGGKF
jgi:hypothetical protein